MCESGEEEVAEIVADETAASVEAILEEAAEKCFILAESDHAVADVAGRQDAIFATQAAGAAAVVGDGDDGGEAGDWMFGSDFVAATGDEIFEAAQESGKSGAAAESDDVESIGRALRFARGCFHDWGHDAIGFCAIRWHAKISGATARAEFMKHKAWVAISDGQGIRAIVTAVQFSYYSRTAHKYATGSKLRLQRDVAMSCVKMRYPVTGYQLAEPSFSG